ncbi:MAG: PTS system mannose/fructose/sorbose family transporter subunit IID, partial [Atopostipes sp.]|nr:PTS system mannose/fructose/sorbose family transporter subunit IID [Atopostipes sp.]
MESNKQKETVDNKNVISETYENPEPKKVITRKDLNKMVWKSLMLQASFNYERMQAG